jgi:phosphate:Na+ symporter
VDGINSINNTGRVMDILLYGLKLSAGIGLFLFAMYLIEESLKNLSGRNFKIFLQKITKNTIGAVVGGAIVTAVLQSSSMVSLMVLAFVGAGVFTMKNAIAIILGANLGTTLSNWIVATLGFKVNIEVAAYPAICIGGILLVIFNNRKEIKYISYFLFGFGLLFIGLSFMKTAMEVQVQSFDFSQYSGMPLSIFLLIGFVITMLVQSSSVTMALTLTALHTNVIDFPHATAIVLGSETGTTIKILLTALGGNAAKKRVAFGNIIFNIFLTIFSFIFLKHILFLITDVFKVNDPLIGLVTFSSLINLGSILIFLPFLTPFTKLIERFFQDINGATTAFIGQANVSEPETALDLFRRETEYFIHNCMIFNLGHFKIDTSFLEEYPVFKSINEKKRFFSMSWEEKYVFLKELQGELQIFYIALRNKLPIEENSQLNQSISAVRSSMYSIKSFKDIESNISNLRHSSKDIKFDFYMHHKKEIEHLYHQLEVLIMQKKKADVEILKNLFNEIHINYSSSLNDFYQEAQQARIDEIDMTTVINFNRELFTSNKAMLMAVKDILLEEKQAQDFNEISVYTT